MQRDASWCTKLVHRNATALSQCQRTRRPQVCANQYTAMCALIFSPHNILMSTYHVTYIFYDRVPFSWNWFIVRVQQFLHFYGKRHMRLMCNLYAVLPFCIAVCFVIYSYWPVFGRRFALCTRVIVRCSIYSVLDPVHYWPHDMSIP